MSLKKMNQCHFRCLDIHQSLITLTDRWNRFLAPCSLKECNPSHCTSKGKHLIPPLTISTEIPSNQIIYLPGIFLPSVEYGLFLVSGVLEFVLTGLAENNQFRATLKGAANV